MNTEERRTSQYPLLDVLCEAKGMKRKGKWKLRDVAQLFDCSVRAIQDLVHSGRLRSRDLPGRTKFLDGDLEEFLRNSVKERPAASGHTGSDSQTPLTPRRGRPLRSTSNGSLFSEDKRED